MLPLLRGFSRLAILAVFLGFFGACTHLGRVGGNNLPPPPASYLPNPAEKHFKSLKQLTFEGTHAEAYFSPDGKKLIFQGHDKHVLCDQMYTMNVDGSDLKLVSKKGGRNTCGYFIDDARILFSSTHKAGPACPKERDRSKGYVWEIFKSYDIYSGKADGSELKPLTKAGNYDAEATVCGGKIVFTSARRGNSLQIYSMNTDGTGVEQLTHQAGYNGGPFFSPDCQRVVYRAFHPTEKAELAAFRKAVGAGYIPHSNLELFAMSADGSDKIQLTAMDAASFAPSFYPHGDKVIFSSNGGGESRVFHLYAVSAKDKLQNQPESITAAGSFNGFPMFSPDGKHLVFASNRNSSNPHELQIFIAEWID